MSFIVTHRVTACGAEQAVAACVAEATSHLWNVVIVVSDAGGIPLMLHRMDGCAASSVDIAIGKAKSAAVSGKETSNLEVATNGSGENRARVALLSSSLLLMEGGVPIIVDGQCIGSVGVSGVRSDQDAQIAHAGVAALSVKSHL
jgi:glc operon protein GlcG